jgi:hypothetical protein
MKSNILIICLLTLITVFTNGCKKEDDDDNNNNNSTTCTDGIQNGDETGIDCGGSCTACVQPNGFTYKGTFYNAELFGVYLFSPSNTYDFAIELSNGTGWDNVNDKIMGSEYTIVRLRTISYTDGNVVGAGEYLHHNSATTPGTIYGGYESFCFRFDSVQYTCVEYPDVIGGRLTVSKTNDIYTLDYDLTLSNGQSLKGYYKGELDYITQD